jgi:hypothetical protein
MVRKLNSEGVPAAALRDKLIQRVRAPREARGLREGG